MRFWNELINTELRTLCSRLVVTSGKTSVFFTVCRMMHVVRDTRQLLPPVEAVRGMRILDKGKFCKYITVPWLEIDEQLVGGAMSVLKKYLLKVLNFKPLRSASELLEGEEVVGLPHSPILLGSSKRIFLNPTVLGVGDIAEQDRQTLEKLGISLKLKLSKIMIGYDNFRADDILKAVLPEENPLTSYSLIGHIVHVNLREHLLPYKQIIGTVLLDKVSGAKTVVNKTDIIDSTYRNFKMEVLCGIENMVTRTREHGCLYELDFSSVYWNPRLSTEHERVTSKLENGDILYDVFAGVGPFSIPAGKKQCYVLANDLNPESYKWLNVSCRLNKVQEFVKTFNKDGRTFIIEDVKLDMEERLKNNKFLKATMHIAMNLPASAVNFLSVFHGLLQGVSGSITLKNCPVVHVYCFVSGENPKDAAQSLVEKNLGSNLGENLVEVCFVRNVAPNKDMMRVSFKLSQDVLMAHSEISQELSAAEEKEEPTAKRIRLSNEFQ